MHGHEAGIVPNKRFERDAAAKRCGGVPRKWSVCTGRTRTLKLGRGRHCLPHIKEVYVTACGALQERVYMLVSEPFLL